MSPNGFLSPPTLSGSGSQSPSNQRRPFLHPTVSRLRSVTPQVSRSPSTGSVGLLNVPGEDLSAAHSHFSALSQDTSSAQRHHQQPNGKEQEDREVFRWTELRAVGNYLYKNTAAVAKAASVLGTPDVGSPTVLTANGLVCIGTDVGRILVFDFKQNLICICGENTQRA